MPNIKIEKAAEATDLSQFAVRDDIAYTPIEAAKILRVALITLAKWRFSGDGPPFARVGKGIRYPRLKSYIDGRTVRSTCEAARKDAGAAA